MFPIQSHTVHLVLQYISPPSLLAQPLPSHLLSKSLIQRHHFLQISPDNAVEYLCWPAPQSAHAIDLLDNFLASPNDHPDEYFVRYTSDTEYTYAHVQVVSQDEGVRMLFQWDDKEGWKYHDTQLMPFPSTSRLTLQQATAESSTADRMSQQPAVATFAIPADSVDDLDYWNAYNGPPDDSISVSPPRGAKDNSSEGTEDAYWAQYSSVQGSADSTVPSPRPINRKLQPAPSTYHSQQEDTIPIPVDAVHSLPLGDHTFGPPSPTTLAHLLKIISPRTDIQIPRSSEPPLSFNRDTPSPLSTMDNSDLLTPASVHPAQYAHVVPPLEVGLNGMPNSNARHECGNECRDDVVDEDKALTDSIKGMYNLWKASKWKHRDQESSDTFLRIARAAISHP